MNKKSLFVFLVTANVVLSTRSQEVFQYDQQSADESLFLEGDLAFGEQPLGQSFAPSLSSVGFVRFYISGGAFGDGTFVVNLRSDSITGPVLASSTTVTMPAASGGFINFFFENPVSVTPSTTYYFQPVSLTGGGWGINGSQFYNYPGGMAFANGVASANGDLWFREGVVVPEPSSGLLVLLGGGVLIYACRLQNKKRFNV
jgi:hypothetical protein